MQEYTKDYVLSNLYKMRGIEVGEWVQDGKYQYKSDIYKDDKGKMFEVRTSRTGSPFTDWDYGDEEIFLVEAEDVVKVETIYSVIKEIN